VSAPAGGDLTAPRPAGERVVELALLAAALVSVLTTAGIVLVLVFETAAFFREVSPAQFLLDDEWTPLFARRRFGIWPLVAGTALTTAVAIATALPLGLLGAIYLSELARPRARDVLKPLLEVLAGIPTIVYGYFALTAVTPWLQGFVPGLAGFNALGAGLMLGVMILPVVASLSDDALRAVPADLREASYALGASRLATIAQVVVPSAASGIGAALLLGVSRAAGETMIVALAAGQQPRLTLDPRVPIETMTAYIAQISMGDTPAGTLAYRTLFAVGMSLFLLTLGLNLLAARLRPASGRRR